MINAQATVPGPRHEALLQLLRSAETIWNASRLFFERWELSPSQFNILNVLRQRGGGLTQIELSRELIMHRSNVTGLVDRLEKRKLVSRKPLSSDRRVWRVILTKAGAKLVTHILPEYYALSERLWNGTGAAKAREIGAEAERLQGAAERLAQELERA